MGNGEAKVATMQGQPCSGVTGPWKTGTGVVMRQDCPQEIAGGGPGEAGPLMRDMGRGDREAGADKEKEAPL